MIQKEEEGNTFSKEVVNMYESDWVEKRPRMQIAEEEGNSCRMRCQPQLDLKLGEMSCLAAVEQEKRSVRLGDEKQSHG